MKATRTVVTLICLLAAAGLAVCLTAEVQARSRLQQENNALRRQLSQREKLLADNQRQSNLVAQAKASPSRPNTPGEELPATEERAKELVRLRGEVEALRQQSQELERLRADTRQVHAASGTGSKTQAGGQAANSYAATADGSQLEIVRAEYWTDRTNMDVAPELRDRIRDGSLKAMASNNIKGDPDFGRVKRLTVVYRFGGMTMTNEFQEGEVVVLPKE